MSAVATTSYGTLQGVALGASVVFKGIPFARPPIGDLRFRAPRPAERWNSMRDATQFGPTAPQIHMEALDPILPWEEEPQSADCLYLNVWTPAADGARRPVLVWIHGGAFTIGSGSMSWYEGRHLAERGDVVVLTVNYRLGALGFLCLRDEGGGEPFTNFGMLDQIAALRWVREEIAAFGGDPENVTMFGESAGGMSVGALMGSPLAAGLFDRAVAQSGAGHNALTTETARETAQRFAGTAGLEALDVEQLRALTTEQILEAQAEAEAGLMQSMAEGNPPLMAFQPVIDGSFLTTMPVEAVRGGLASDVTLLVGHNAEEGKLMTAMAPRDEYPDDQLAQAFAARLVDASALELGREALTMYRKEREARGEAASNKDLYEAADTDYMFRVPADRLASAQASRKPQTYMYRLA